MVAKDGRTQAILGGAGHASYLALIGGVSMPIWLSGLVNCDCCVVRRDPTPPFNRQPSPTTLDVDDNSLISTELADSGWIFVGVLFLVTAVNVSLHTPSDC